MRWPARPQWETTHRHFWLDAGTINLQKFSIVFSIFCVKRIQIELDFVIELKPKA